MSVNSNEKLKLSHDYPHSLMLHISEMLKERDSKNPDQLLDTRFIDEFKIRFRDFPIEVMQLEIAYEEKVIHGFVENNKQPEWRKRVLLNTVLKILVKRLKEYQAVEIVESLMFLFRWEFQIECIRKWEVSEEDKAKFHSFENTGAFVKNSFQTTAKEHLSEREAKKLRAPKKMIKKKEDEVKLPEKTPESTNGIVEDSRRGETVSRRGEAGSQRGETASRREEVVSARGETAPRREEAVSKRRENVSQKEESISKRGTASLKREEVISKKEKDIVLEVLQTEELTEDEYLRQLQEITIKHESLMSLSVRKEVKKAKKGDAMSQCFMGDFYAEEQTEHTDYEEAVRWYSFAARQGNFKAKLQMGRIFDSEKLEGKNTKPYGFRYFKELAEEGYPTAQCIMGMKYYFGDGVEKDTVKGVQWLKKAGYQGHVEAQRQLGELYSKKDKKEAAKWFRMAKANGDFTAEKRLKML